jgi:aryl-alcohol dehydrogenase-like predicted oxidoreductase
VYVKEAMANGRLAHQDDVALAAALAQPWATVVLSGAASVEVLRSNLRARELPAPGELPELIEDSASYWARRSSLDWN